MAHDQCMEIEVKQVFALGGVHHYLVSFCLLQYADMLVPAINTLGLAGCEWMGTKMRCRIHIINTGGLPLSKVLLLACHSKCCPEGHGSLWVTLTLPRS